MQPLLPQVSLQFAIAVPLNPRVVLPRGPVPGGAGWAGWGLWGSRGVLALPRSWGVTRVVGCGDAGEGRPTPGRGHCSLVGICPRSPPSASSFPPSPFNSRNPPRLLLLFPIPAIQVAAPLGRLPGRRSPRYLLGRSAVSRLAGGRRGWWSWWAGVNLAARLCCPRVHLVRDPESCRGDCPPLKGQCAGCCSDPRGPHTTSPQATPGANLWDAGCRAG